MLGFLGFGRHQGCGGDEVINFVQSKEISVSFLTPYPEILNFSLFDYSRRDRSRNVNLAKEAYFYSL